MKKFIIFAAVAMALAACSNEEENEILDNPVAARISAGVDTRAVNNEWEADEIGVMVTSGNIEMGNQYKNVHYTTTATGAVDAAFEPVNEIIYFQCPDDITFTAYGPYEASAASVLPLGNGVISKETLAQASRDAQKAIDFIYASEKIASRSNPEVNFEFEHVMTRLIINVATSVNDGFESDEVTDGQYYLKGLIHSGTFDTTTGEAKAHNLAPTDWELNNCLREESTSRDRVTFTSILYPQALSTDLEFIVEISGQTYTAKIRPDLISGQSYTYNITVKKTGLEVSGCIIADWTDGGDNAVDATM